ncbi:hypothetical protein QBC37DRAFT_77706 [Rhypophila decipiens]|uniref:Amine oxidase n=1 Tax=Rhypophila decipiens TaxID=261697 RepID=A0AAN6YE94_9PEZI|nr:hypothetical protein QBC37DRAFT_77706 [Rhypophila decipiens]
MRGLEPLAALLVSAPGTIASKQWVRELYRDVVIIGGGASGAYSAVRLREDYGVSVVLIEKEEILGGHVNTWIDPSTSRAFDAGVQSYIDLPGAIPFFNRFNISTIPNVRNSNSPIYVDFTTGTTLADYSPPSTSDRNDALRRYISLCESYDPVMEPGWWSFPSPANATIPEDLLLPFRDFVVKHNLTSAVPQIFSTTGFGNHDLLSSLTMFVMRSFSADMTRVLLGLTPGFVPASRNNQDLYTAIHKFLGADVLTSTVVTAASRSSKEGIILKVRNSQTAEITRIEAKRLLYTIPPTAENLLKFDLDNGEKAVFETLQYSSSFVGIVSHPSLPLDSAIINVPSSAQPSNWLSSLPEPPYTTRFDNYPNSSYYRVVVTGDQDLSATSAKGIIQDNFNKLIATGVLDQSSPPEDLKFYLFEPHGRVSAYVDRQDVEAGFMTRLNDLQGKRGTWYTGAAWSVHITTSLWIFTDTVLPKLVDSLKYFGAHG